MKAKELMIGDWVCIDEPDKYAGATGQIQSLMYHGEGDAAYFNVFIQGKLGYVSRDVCSDDIRPIPLTPEILEKNGFKLKEEIGIYGVTIVSHYICKGVPFEVFCDGDPFAIWFEDPINIKYTHQLQHALRLCGIDKEIIL